MSLLVLLLGIALVALALVDALWTTLWVDGSGGPVSSRITTWLWRALLGLNGRRHHATLSLAGPVILVSIVTLWVCLLWAGWVLVFASGEGSLVDPRTDQPADWAGRIYFIAYTMFTMGNGDFSPRGSVWQIVAAVTNGSGMFLITLAITYLISVVSAVVEKRAFASQVLGMGRTAEEFVEAGWNGRDFRSLDLPLSSMSVALGSLSEKYLAYPILQYYHAARPSKSPVIAAVVLDDALTILRYGMSETARPNPAVLRSARATVASFLETMPSAFIHPAPEAPPAPDLRKLGGKGIPVVEEGFGAALDDLEDRRRRLLGLLRNDGWTWSDR